MDAAQPDPPAPRRTPRSTACASDSADTTVDVATIDDVSSASFEPSPPSILRLTQAHYRHVIEDLFGSEIVVPTALEPDSQVDGMESLGAAIASLSPRGVELYEEGARNIAKQVFENEQAREEALVCTPQSADDLDCFRTFTATHGRRIFRRPLTEAELDLHVSVGQQAATALEDPNKGAEYILAALLQSPYFIYRAELGTGEGPERALSAFELASRLSFFFWSSGPDDALLDAAQSGELETVEGIQAQVERLMDDDRAVRSVRNFFKEWLALSDLKHMSKDPNIFKHYSADLGQMAREETLRLAEYLVFE